MRPIDAALVGRLHRQSDAGRWHVSPEQFAATLSASASRAFAGQPTDPAELERYLTSLHLADLALACGCALGDDAAWEHFVSEYRPGLYRAADALEPEGGARELADSLYADLFGLTDRDGVRQSLFRYFHGRSRLTTWLRAVLSQRVVDRARAATRHTPMPEEDSPAALVSSDGPPDPDRPADVVRVHEALQAAIDELDPRDRFRLRCYYAQGLTLAEVGRLVGEHEATVSRQLARVRRDLRAGVEQRLRKGGLSDAQVGRAITSVTEDVGALDVDALLGSDGRKKVVPLRSQEEDVR